MKHICQKCHQPAGNVTQVRTINNTFEDRCDTCLNRQYENMRQVSVDPKPFRPSFLKALIK